ncbi:MAG: succinylglutamate desuccinylase/aspartoacylase family protein [Acidobacteria bacterium]|nr:succinylglutamate desuccinylase/aspartoacylase family protein [Acidobacteriota bacterium]
MTHMTHTLLVAALVVAGPANAGHHGSAAGHHESVASSVGWTAAVTAQADAHPTFTVGTATAQRGQKAYGVMHVPAGSDAGYDIPVVVIHGARPGPVLAVVSGAHGTEYASILSVEALIDNPAAAPANLSGTLILVPLVNVPSFERLTPHVNPNDNKSMNSRYPGDPNGTQTDRASAVITWEVVEQCDHLIDLHGGDLDENLRPYSYWTVTGNAKQDEFSRGMVLAFGLDHIIISRERPKDPKASRFLENTASTRGKPSFTAEAGRSGPVDAGDVTMLSDGVLKVTGYLKMTRRPARDITPVAKPVWVEVTSIASEYNGVFFPRVPRDAHVAKGATIGLVKDALNRPIAEIKAPDAGIIMFIRALPSLKQGDTIASLGVITQEPK